jgi:hypothetical protein
MLNQFDLLSDFSFQQGIERERAADVLVGLRVFSLSWQRQSAIRIGYGQSNEARVGGTDFRPAIAGVVKWKPDLLIYLTTWRATPSLSRRFRFCRLRMKAKREAVGQNRRWD